MAILLFAFIIFDSLRFAIISKSLLARVCWVKCNHELWIWCTHMQLSLEWPYATSAHRLWQIHSSPKYLASNQLDSFIQINGSANNNRRCEAMRPLSVIILAVAHRVRYIHLAACVYQTNQLWISRIFRSSYGCSAKRRRRWLFWCAALDVRYTIQRMDESILMHAMKHHLFRTIEVDGQTSRHTHSVVLGVQSSENVLVCDRMCMFPLGTPRSTCVVRQTQWMHFIRNVCIFAQFQSGRAF